MIAANFRRTHSPSPVSYTHLRAHETVLDLVCRLLLEKKIENLLIVSAVMAKSLVSCFF